MTSIRSDGSDISDEAKLKLAEKKESANKRISIRYNAQFHKPNQMIKNNVKLVNQQSQIVGAFKEANNVSPTRKCEHHESPQKHKSILKTIAEFTKDPDSPGFAMGLTKNNRLLRKGTFLKENSKLLKSIDKMVNQDRKISQTDNNSEASLPIDYTLESSSLSSKSGRSTSRGEQKKTLDVNKIRKSPSLFKPPKHIHTIVPDRPSNILKAVQCFIDKESEGFALKSKQAQTVKDGKVGCLEFNDELKATILKKHDFNSKDIQLQKQNEKRLRELEEKYVHCNSEAGTAISSIKPMKESKFVKKRFRILTPNKSHRAESENLKIDCKLRKKRRFKNKSYDPRQFINQYQTQDYEPNMDMVDQEEEENKQMQTNTNSMKMNDQQYQQSNTSGNIIKLSDINYNQNTIIHDGQFSCVNIERSQNFQHEMDNIVNLNLTTESNISEQQVPKLSYRQYKEETGQRPTILSKKQNLAGGILERQQKRRLQREKYNQQITQLFNDNEQVVTESDEKNLEKCFQPPGHLVFYQSKDYKKLQFNRDTAFANTQTTHSMASQSLKSPKSNFGVRGGAVRAATGRQSTISRTQRQQNRENAIQNYGGEDLFLKTVKVIEKQKRPLSSKQNQSRNLTGFGSCVVTAKNHIQQQENFRIKKIKKSTCRNQDLDKLSFNF